MLDSASSLALYSYHMCSYFILLWDLHDAWSLLVVTSLHLKCIIIYMIYYTFNKGPIDIAYKILRRVKSYSRTHSTTGALLLGRNLQDVSVKVNLYSFGCLSNSMYLSAWKSSSRVTNIPRCVVYISFKQTKSSV